MTTGVPLAWRQLSRERKRLAAALAGIAFAVLLMLVQLGFEQALFRSVGLFYSHLNADLMMISPKYQNMPSPGSFTERRLYQALGSGDVEWVCPVYLSDGIWKNPFDHRERVIFVIAFQPQAGVFTIPEVNEKIDELRQPDAILFDAFSRPEFGPVAQELRSKGRLAVQVSNLTMQVAGVFELGTSFANDGNIITSDITFHKLNTTRTAGLPNVGLIRLKAGGDVKTAARKLADALPKDVLVMTRQELVQREEKFWAGNTPIGFVFRLGLIMGLIVGCVVVYQILYSDVTEHLAEYATLKAMGYTDGFLFGVVLQESLILSVLGFLPGVALSQVVYTIAQRATLLPLRMDPVRVGAVYLLTAIMCSFSGALAMRRLRAADPAEIF